MATFTDIQKQAAKLGIDAYITRNGFLLVEAGYIVKDEDLLKDDWSGTPLLFQSENIWEVEAWAHPSREGSGVYRLRNGGGAS